jgi:DNA-binding CsgD family transcriptional regulator
MKTPSPAGRPVFVGEMPTNGTHELLHALFSSTTFGVAICDRQFRFRAINDALAAMNGIPAEAHLNKTLHSVLGKVSSKLVPIFRRVFNTGQPVTNFEFTAALPKRSDPGHWIANYLPIRNHTGEIHQVAAIVIELTRQSAIEACVLRLIDQLLRTNAAFRTSGRSSFTNRRIHKELSRDNPMAGLHSVIENCLSETLAISRLLNPLGSGPRNLVLASGVTTGIPGGVDATLPVSASSAEPRQTLLSSREKQVATLLASGKLNKQIADEMRISIRTVETYRGRIMLKLGLNSVPDLVRYALRSGLIV